ncbi:MAG TPA: methyltransferase domain-containing protein [Bryobacteraceae bacterium]|nr:methyltransferase domain-containing protein [Bryobacteraceae bacterium]
MHEILAQLRPGQRVLDLGSAGGSFDAAGAAYVAIRADLDRPPRPAADFAQADAARLPFADAAFDAVISNHSLEHFEDLAGSLAEIGRVLKPTGALYIGVPDASTFCDRLYRWLARGGGHVNAFTSPEELAAKIERATQLPHVATRTLFASLSYLNRRNGGVAGPRRTLLVGGGTELSLRLYNYFARLNDRFFGTRLSVYGWALYFGSFADPIDTAIWTNVCIRCGAAASSEWLRGQSAFCRRSFIRVYRCPSCGTSNVFSEDRQYDHLRASEAKIVP